VPCIYDIDIQLIAIVFNAIMCIVMIHLLFVFVQGYLLF